MTTNKALEKIDDIINKSASKNPIEVTGLLQLVKSLAKQAIQEDRERIIHECSKYRIRYFYGADDIAFHNIIKIVKGEKVE